MSTTENNTTDNFGDILSGVKPGEKTKVTIDNKSYYVQIPENGIDGNTSFLVAGRGSGSILDTNETFDQSVGKNTVVIAPENTSTEVFSKAIDIADYYKKANNNTTETTVQGHSATCGTVLQAEINHNAQTNTKSTIVFCDSHTSSPMNIKNMETISGSTVINFTDDLTPNTQEYVTKMAKNGANILSIEYSTKLGKYSHGFSDELAANSNIQSIGTDGTYNLDNLPSTVSYHPAELGTTQNVNVQYSFSCTDSSGNKIKLTKSQAQEYLNISSEIEKAYNEKNSSGSYSAAIGASKKLADAQKKLDALINDAKNNTEDMYANDNLGSNLEETDETSAIDEKSEKGDSDSDITQSDTVTVEDFVNEMTSKINSSTVVVGDIQAASYSSTTSVPSEEPNVFARLLTAAKQFSSKLSNEVAYIQQVGDEFEEMDNFLGQMAMELNCEINSVKSNEVTVSTFDEQTPDYTLSDETRSEYEDYMNEQGEGETPSEPTPSPTPNPTPSVTPSEPTPSTPSPTPSETPSEPTPSTPSPSPSETPSEPTPSTPSQASTETSVPEPIIIE